MKSPFPIHQFRVICLTSLSASVFFSSCSSIAESVGSGVTWATKRPGSFKTKKEKVLVSMRSEGSGAPVIFPAAEKKDEVDTIDPNKMGFAIPAVLAGAAAGYIVDGIEKGVESTAGNYSVVYSGTRIGDDLPNAHGFYLRREAEGKVAATIQMDFNKSGNAYTLGLSNIDLQQSKSAIPAWDDDVDMVIKVQLSVLNPEQNSMDPVIDTQFEVKSIELGKLTSFENSEHRTSWFRFPNYEVDRHNPKVPYKLVVTVQETSNFYKVAEKGKTLVSNKKKDWTTSLKEALSGDD